MFFRLNGLPSLIEHRGSRLYAKTVKKIIKSPSFHPGSTLHGALCFLRFQFHYIEYKVVEDGEMCGLFFDM